jgi:hypothetical protein
LSFGYGVLIGALRGWHIALYELPVRTREGLAKGGYLVVETVAGRHLTGDVVTEFATANGEYMLLTGDALYARRGRPSVASEYLLRAQLAQILYAISSERRLVEQLEYNLLLRWLVGLPLGEPVFHVTSFTKNRDRLLSSAVNMLPKYLPHSWVLWE